MRSLLLLGVLALTGCQSVIGPLEYHPPLRVDDPTLPIYLQERLGRSRIGLPYDTWLVAPPVDLTPPNFYQPGGVYNSGNR